MKRYAFLAGTAAAFAGTPRFAHASVLQSRIERLASASSGVVGVYARRMDHSVPIAYNANVIFPSASVIKLAIFVSLFQYAEASPGVFAQTIRLQVADFVPGSEILDRYNPGSTISIDRLARAMIQESDNTASNVLIDFLGFERIMRTVHRAGLHHTQLKRHFQDRNAIAHHSENLTTAHDMGLLLYNIERGAHEALHTVASPKSCRRMIDILLRQEDHDKIARGLPKGMPLANKTGEIDGVRNDIGIVDPYGDSPYVISVLTKELADFSLGNIAIRNIAKAVHGALY